MSWTRQGRTISSCRRRGGGGVGRQVLLSGTWRNKGPGPSDITMGPPLPLVKYHTDGPIAPTTSKQHTMFCPVSIYHMGGWVFYALSASKAIFRASTYSHITYSVRWWWLLDEWNVEEPRLKLGGLCWQCGWSQVLPKRPGWTHLSYKKHYDPKCTSPTCVFRFLDQVDSEES